MSYRVIGLDPSPFRHLYHLSDEALATHNARRYIVDRTPGFPDRVELRDLQPGETALLLNYVHQPGDSPYRASHAIFVREGAERAAETVGRLPEVMQHRPLSLRAFDTAHMMVDATLVSGADAEGPILALLDDPRVSYVQAHYAVRGCYAARIERA
ncbi:hypothetical protein TBR22_A14960 [Luteitalea sp. TBR-22]|uniref:DUF1203 domain-containing protein n=1 Tax=Luteitalea sp. TBR-22 TaxID=2802971 RepID=UPI001AF416F0|nr:DUF1203 domain-containing protein [Luteitalea sp. TBR-22]BCS32286.1 hypothetical protein TBR22_A14960 [Luteitalea sp. TBR-22]